MFGIASFRGGAILNSSDEIGHIGHEVNRDSILINIGTFNRTIDKQQELSDWYMELHEDAPSKSSVPVSLDIRNTELSGRSGLIVRMSEPLNSVIYLVRNDEKVYFIQKWPAVSKYDDFFAKMIDSFYLGSSATTGGETLPYIPEIRESQGFSGITPMAPSGYVPPTQGYFLITSGPRCHCQHAQNIDNCATTYAHAAEAVDFGTPLNTHIRASSSGVLTYAEYNDQGYGNLVRIEDANGRKAYYAHLNWFAVYAEDYNEFHPQSTLIGGAGNSGTSSVHLHMEVRTSGNQPVVITDMPAMSYSNCGGTVNYSGHLR